MTLTLREWCEKGQMNCEGAVCGFVIDKRKKKTKDFEDREDVKRVE